MAKRRRKKAMSDEQLISLIARRRSSGLNANETELSTRRKDNLDRYMGEPYGDERAGQSSVVTRQCLEAVEWTLPSMMRVFLSSDKAVEFNPTGAEDEAGAKQESDYVNHVFMKENDGFELLYTWIKDILINPNGYIKVYWDESEEVTTETYEGLMPQDLAELDADPELEPIEQSETVAMALDPNGMEVPVTIYDVKYKRTKKVGQVKIDSIPPEEITVDGRASRVSLEDTDFVSHRTYVRRFELIDSGFSAKVVNSLPLAGGETDQENEKSHRFEVSTGTSRDEEDSNDRATDLIEVDETHLLVDLDGNGIAEYYCIKSSGKHILSKEPEDYNPFISGCAVPMPHAHVGMSWLELVKDLQKVYTTLTRQMLNNLYRTNNPRTIVGRGVNMADVVNDIPNAPIRAKNIENIRIEPTQSVIQNIVPAFGLLNEMKDTRTGVSRGTMGLDADELSRVTKGAFLGSLDQANQRLELLARIMAEFSIKKLFLKIHRLLLTHQKGVKEAKIKGQWINVNPSEWNERKDMTVIVGLGTGNKQAQSIALDKVFEAQRELKMSGSRMVTDQNIYSSLEKLIEVTGLHNTERYFTDPANLGEEPPKPPGGDDALAAAQMELAKVEREKANLEARVNMEELKQKASDDARKAETKIAELQAELAEAKDKSEQGWHDLERKDFEAEGKLHLEAKRIGDANKAQAVANKLGDHASDIN